MKEMMELRETKQSTWQLPTVQLFGTGWGKWWRAYRTLILAPVIISLGLLAWEGLVRWQE